MSHCIYRQHPNTVLSYSTITDDERSIRTQQGFYIFSKRGVQKLSSQIHTQQLSLDREPGSESDHRTKRFAQDGAWRTRSEQSGKKGRARKM